MRKSSSPAPRHASSPLPTLSWSRRPRKTPSRAADRSSSIAASKPREPPMRKKQSTEQLTPLELEIMKVLWETGPAPVQAVQERLAAERPLAYNTVQTMLNVLHRKGKVRRELRARAYYYEPSVSQLQAAQQAVGDL